MAVRSEDRQAASGVQPQKMERWRVEELERGDSLRFVRQLQRDDVAVGVEIVRYLEGAVGAVLRLPDNHRNPRVDRRTRRFNRSVVPIQAYAHRLGHPRTLLDSDRRPCDVQRWTAAAATIAANASSLVPRPSM